MFFIDCINPSNKVETVTPSSMNPENPNPLAPEEQPQKPVKAESDMDFELPEPQEGASCYVGCDVCQ